MSPNTFRPTSLTEAPLTEAQAYYLLLGYCVVYVLPLHVLSRARLLPSRSRDDPSVIHSRVRSVYVSTTACSLSTLFIIVRSSEATGSRQDSHYASSSARFESAFHLMGYWPLGLLETAKASLLTALLFAGPIFECLLVDGLWRQWLRLAPLKRLCHDWPTWRNIVAGPVTEETLFRSAATPLLILAGANLSSIIFWSPLVFGLAHVHHFYEFRKSSPRTPVSAAIARSAFQFFYTSIFGIYATFIFVQTSSLLAVICVHSVCNSLGLPRLWGAVEPYWLSCHDSNFYILRARWTIFYYFVLLAGICLWYYNLYNLTESPLALVTI